MDWNRMVEERWWRYTIQAPTWQRILRFVRHSLNSRRVNLLSVTGAANMTGEHELNVDESLSEFTVSVSGHRPVVNVTDPAGLPVTGPPKLHPLVNLENVTVVNIQEPDPGSWRVKVTSDSGHVIRSTGVSNVDFITKFSTLVTSDMDEASHRPLKGQNTSVLIKPTQAGDLHNLTLLRLVSLEGEVLKEIPLRPVAESPGLHRGEPFFPPYEFFYLEINGFDKDGFPIKRISPTAISGQDPALPIVTMRPRTSGWVNEPVTLRCHVESLVPFKVMWFKGVNPISGFITYQQTSKVLWHFKNPTENLDGNYTCWARNLAGIGRKVTYLYITGPPPKVETSPQVISAPNKKAYIHCFVRSTLEHNVTWARTKTIQQHSSDDLQHLDEDARIAIFENGTLAIDLVTTDDEGWYVCIAKNKGGQNDGLVYLAVREAIEVTVAPEKVDFQRGDTFTLSCQAKGTPKPNITWKKDRRKILQDVGSEDVDQANVDEFLQSHSLELTNEDLLEMENSIKDEEQEPCLTVQGPSQQQELSGKSLQEQELPEPSREQEPTIQGPSREQENDNPDLPYPNEPDCYATQLLLENTNEFIVHTILKPEKTSNVPSTALCEEHIIKDELCFDESSIDVKENTIIKLSQNLTNELQINDNQLKSKTFLKIDPNLGHSGVKKYQCDYCFMVFTNKKYLKSHTSIHGRHKRSNKCGVCGKCFTKIELKIHLSNSGHRPYKCDICGKCFATKNYLKIHICTHGGQSGHGPYKCEICGRCFNKKEYLKSHLPTHSGQKPHKCDACGKCFTRKGSLTTHLLSHSGEENSSKYEKCFDGSSFDISKANIIELSKNFVNGTKKNVRNQGKGSLLKDTTFEKIDPNLSPIDVKKYNCEGYNKLFSNMINLKRHIVTDRGLRPHRCDICGKCFKQTSVLNYHILTHGGQRLICDVCGKCFKRKDYLKSHILTHSGKKPHKCDVCGKSFLRKDYLKLHFFNHNDQKRTNKCEVCGKCFTSSYSLKVHHLIHSGLKPHKCDICDKCFTKKSHLKIHLRIHNKSKPLNCGICGKSFYRNDHLKNHLLTHSEHSPLKCDVCGKCFNLKRILKIHMLTHIK
uniref:Uncharacterized protein n=1 Tax=Timema cristinae TaxID=61476 RepID=A0A7R9H6U1_TIMCR|nr:unnamed protein product [Timema cristinae]